MRFMGFRVWAVRGFSGFGMWSLGDVGFRVSGYADLVFRVCM